MPLKRRGSAKNKKTQRKSRQPSSESPVLENDPTLTPNIPPNTLATPSAEPAQTVQPLELTPVRDQGQRVEHDKHVMRSHSQPSLQLTRAEPGTPPSIASSALPALSFTHTRPHQDSPVSETTQPPLQSRNFVSSSKSPKEIDNVVNLFEPSPVPFDPSSIFNKDISSEDVENMLMDEYKARIKLHEEKMKANGQKTMKYQYDSAVLRPGGIILDDYGQDHHLHVRHGPLPPSSEEMSGLEVVPRQRNPSDRLHASYESRGILTPRGVEGETTSDKTPTSSFHLESGGDLKSENGVISERKKEKEECQEEGKRERKEEGEASCFCVPGRAIRTG